MVLRWEFVSVSAMPAKEFASETDFSVGSLDKTEFAPDDFSDLQLCRKLRSKLLFSAVETDGGEPVSALSHMGSAAVYYCLSTMGCAGPDGGLAHVDLCGKGRACCAARGEVAPV